MQCRFPKTFTPKGSVSSITVPCGMCRACRVNKTTEWAIRCLYEMESHDKSCFITLTYNDEFLPENGSLDFKQIADFFKRVRKRYYGNKAGELKYYLCGEYGPTTFRPHYHAVLFGIDFEPEEWILFKTDKDGPHYTSPTLLDLWPFGFNEVSFVNQARLNYVAGYIQKKLKGVGANVYKERGVVPPDQRYSKNLGVNALKKDAGRLTQLFLEHKGKPLQTYYAHKLGLNEFTDVDGYQLSYMYYKQAKDDHRAKYPELSDVEYAELMLSIRQQANLDDLAKEKILDLRNGL